VRRLLVLLSLFALVLGVPSVAGARGVTEDPAPTGPDCVTTASTTQPGYTVADPRCTYAAGGYPGARFVPLTDAAGTVLSRTYTGILAGAPYRIEVPTGWNGELVLYAHGFRGAGTTVSVDDSPLRRYLVEHGFAWAASGYATNGYDVGQGVRDSHALIGLFAGKVRTARTVYMTGLSMGGHITAVAVERYRREFAGAMPGCGVLGDKELFDYFTDANVTAAALTGTPIRFPGSPAEGQAYTPEYAAAVSGQLPALGGGFGTGNPRDVTLTAAGRAWAGVVQQRSGGTRPGFAGAFAYWASIGYGALPTAPFLFGVYPGLTGGTQGIAAGNLSDNRFTAYRIEDGYGPLTRAERALNRSVLRVAPTARPSAGLDGVPKVAGDPRVPVVSMHDLGDLFVPFSMEQVYAARVAVHGQARLLVTRAIRGVGHCDFTPAELQTGFADLVRWVRTGTRPAGDPVLDPRAVASPTFGCRFTTTPHPDFTGAPCP
jgi:hypothetical protein